MQPQPGLRLKLKLPPTAATATATATDGSTRTDNAAGDINTATVTPTRATGFKVKLNIKVPSTPAQNDHAQQQQRGQEPFPTLPIASSSSSPSHVTPKIKLNLKKRIADDTPSSPAQNPTSDGEGYSGRTSTKRSKLKINREDSTATRPAEKETNNPPVTPKIKFLTRSEPLSTPIPQPARTPALSSTSSPSTSIAPTNLPSTPTPRIRLKTPSSKARPQARARVKSKLRERLDLGANGTGMNDEGRDSEGAGEVDLDTDGMRGQDGQAHTQVEPVPPPKEISQEDGDLVDLEGDADADADADGDGDMDADMDPEGNMDQDQDDQDEGDQESDLNTPSTPNGHSLPDSNSNSNSNSTHKTLTRKGFNRKPFAFRKKPLPHLLRLIIGNLRRKDAYGLFFDPVDLKEYPDYLQVIGGEDRAMDLGTMESKAEGGEYRRMEDFEADVEKMITAAQKFNPDDTLVHREAAKVAQLAEKQIARYRSLVKTPSPSPEPGYGTPRTGPEGSTSRGQGTPFDRSVSPAGTMDGTRTGVERPAVAALQPRQLVPEGMLAYPPNSDIARCVGYLLSGGKRPRTKKEQRAKEKWDGQWREWNTEGDRNLREADNVLDLFTEGFEFDSNGKTRSPRVVDWEEEGMNSSTTWQPTPTLTGVAADEVVPRIPTRQVNHLDFGRTQNLPASYGFPDFKKYDSRKFLRDLRMDLDGAWRDEEREGMGERSSRLIKEICLGDDTASEAYVRSLNTFVTGARAWVGEDTTQLGTKRKREEQVEMEPVERTAVKVEAGLDEPTEPPRPREYAAFDELKFDLGMPLDQYINTQWRGGWLEAGARKTVKIVQEVYPDVLASKPIQERSPKKQKLESTEQEDEAFDITDIERDLYRAAVSDAIQRVPLALEVEEYAARRNGLDLACLLHTSTDFATGSSSTGPPPNNGPGRAAWYEESLKLAGNQLVDAYERRRTLPEGGLEGDDEQERLKKLRLDLLSLAKNVPVYELRPMTPLEVEKLPLAVRGLIKVVGV